MADRVVYEDTVGSTRRPSGPRISQLEDLPWCLRQALQQVYESDICLTPPQSDAEAMGIVSGRGHFLIATPTNSGKTLAALLRIFAAAIRGGQRSVYVVPLKALAEEKLADFQELSESIHHHGGPPIKISITTGDYQLTEDFLGSPPPDAGEIVVCTPERLEVMLRNPENHSWARAVGTFVIDEFHLLGERRRGATLETLITRILISCPWSSIIALSATAGGVGHIENWLGHTGKSVSVISSQYRYPQLNRRVVISDDKLALLQRIAHETAGDATKTLLIFVYRKNDARRLSRELAEALGQEEIVSFFHAGLPLSERRNRMRRLRQGDIRVLVTTTSLKMGINCPVTYVVVRDHLFREKSRSFDLSTADILQMMGRAGRKDTPGHALVLCDTEEVAARYSDDLATGRVPELSPQLLRPVTDSRFRGGNATSATNPLNSVVLTQIVLDERTTPDEVSEFISHTFSATRYGLALPDVRQQFACLERGKLIYQAKGSEESYCPTKLGRTVALTGLSPESGAILAGFLRGLINLGEKRQKQKRENSNFLSRLSDVDLLFLAVASFECRDNLLPKRTSTSKTSILSVQEYMETLDPEKKPVINLWRSEDSEEHPTRRLLASLKIDYDRSKEGAAERTFYWLMRTAILLHKHAHGTPLSALAAEYDVPEGNLENGLKFTATWVLSCLGQICNSRRCYRLDSLMMRILELLENLSLGATLGPLLKIKGVGRRTVMKLIEQGMNAMDRVECCSLHDLVNAGITKEQARKIMLYVGRRSR